MKKVRIKGLSLLSSNDRGTTFQMHGERTEGYLLAHRVAGSVSGNHWHKGLAKGKNPERLLLIRGSMEIFARDLRSGNEVTHNVDAPAEIEIPPYVYHRVTAISDCDFLEFNSLEEHQRDTFYDKEI